MNQELHPEHFRKEAGLLLIDGVRSFAAASPQPDGEPEVGQDQDASLWRFYGHVPPGGDHREDQTVSHWLDLYGFCSDPVGWTSPA